MNTTSGTRKASDYRAGYRWTFGTAKLLVGSLAVGALATAFAGLGLGHPFLYH